MGCKFCSETLEKAVVGLSMLSYKSHLFPSLTTFWRKNGVANIIDGTFKCISFCSEMLEKAVVGLSMLSYKSHLFPSLTAFWKKNGDANYIITGTFKCKLLFRNARKSCRWVKHAFL